MQTWVRPSDLHKYSKERVRPLRALSSRDESLIKNIILDAVEWIGVDGEAIRVPSQW